MLQVEQVPLAIMFDIDSTLIFVDGAGSRSWAHAFHRLHGVELLPSLTDAGILLGLVSGNVEVAARIKLGRGRLNRFFAVGGYGSDSADRGALTRTAIERCAVIHGHTAPPERVLVVGDTPRDIEAAHAAGAVAVGVATGKYTVDALQAAGADYVVPTLETPLPGVRGGPGDR